MKAEQPEWMLTDQEIGDVLAANEDIHEDGYSYHASNGTRYDTSGAFGFVAEAQARKLMQMLKRASVGTSTNVVIPRRVWVLLCEGLDIDA